MKLNQSHENSHPPLPLRLWKIKCESELVLLDHSFRS